jgi:uncharacterized membrane protein YjjP (DUF1212 family)
MTPATHMNIHKIPTINYLVNRVHTYSITKEAKEKELNSIKDTLYSNEYNIILGLYGDNFTILPIN